MNIKEIFKRILDNNVEIFLKNDNIGVKKTDGKISNEILQLIKDNKKDIVEYLKLFPNINEMIFHRDENSEIIPSFSQERLSIFQNTIPNHSRSMNTVLSVNIIGDLKIDILKKCIEKIVLKHNVLRSNFIYDNELKVKIKSKISIDHIFDYYDCCEKGTDFLNDIIEEKTKKPFNLANDDLIRVLLVRNKIDNYDLYVTISNLVTDGWSAQIFFKELNVAYNNLLDDNVYELDDNVIDYWDYSSFIRNKDYLTLDKKEIDYWKNHLSDIDNEIVFINKIENRAEKSYIGKKKKFFFSEKILQKMKELSKKNQSTIFVQMLTYIQLMLLRNTYNRNFAMYVPIINRNNTVLQNIIGLFDNLFIFKADTEGVLTINQQLNKNKNIIYDAFENQSVPFEVILCQLKKIPKFQIQVSMLDKSMKNLELSECDVTNNDYDLGTCMCDIEIYFWESEDGIKGHFQYSTDLFDESMIENLISDMYSIVETHLDYEDVKLSDILKGEGDNEGAVLNIKKRIVTLIEEILKSSNIDLNKTIPENGIHSLSMYILSRKLKDMYNVNIDQIDMYNISVNKLIDYISDKEKV